MINVKASCSTLPFNFTRTLNFSRTFVPYYQLNGVSNGEYIWTDGVDIYFTFGEFNNKKLDKTTMTWKPISWGNSDDLPYWGSYMWSDGTDIYYNDEHHPKSLKLDRETNSWKSVSWGFNFRGDYVWTDGTKTYLSYGSQYELNTDTMTWDSMTWQTDTGETLHIVGRDVWSDGQNIYYASFKLNDDTGIWEKVDWDSTPSGSSVWSDGTNFYSGNSRKINVDTYTSEDFDGFINAWAQNNRMWTDGVNVYCTNQDGKTWILLPVGAKYYSYDGSRWDSYEHSNTSVGTTTPSGVTTEEATVTPSESTQYVTPKNADYLSKVTVKAIPPEYKKVSGSTTVTENNRTVNVTNLASLTVAIPEFDGKVEFT